jgi:hypothetical protein
MFAVQFGRMPTMNPGETAGGKLLQTVLMDAFDQLHADGSGKQTQKSHRQVKRLFTGQLAQCSRLLSRSDVCISLNLDVEQRRVRGVRAEVHSKAWLSHHL